MKKGRPAMNFCIGTSDEYAKYAVVTMASICINNPHGVKRFYVIGDEFKPETLKILRETADKFEFEINIHVMDLGQFDWLKMDRRWTRITLFPFILNKIMPAKVDRCLCLEVDTMVTGDISDYYYVDMGNSVMAGSPIGFGIKQGVNAKRLTLSPGDVEEKRINAGIMLFDMEKIRKENIDMEFYRKSYYDNLNGATTTGETVLNLSHRGRILYINPALFHYRSYFHGAYSKRGYNAEDRRIVHFTDRRPLFQKPWIVLFENNSEMYFDPSEKVSKETQNLIQNLFSEWWEYAKHSVNYSELVSSMEERRDFYRKYLWPIIDKNAGHASDRDKMAP